MGLPLPIPLGRSPPSPSLLPSPPRAEQHYLRSRKRANLEVEGVGGRGEGDERGVWVSQGCQKKDMEYDLNFLTFLIYSLLICSGFSYIILHKLFFVSILMPTLPFQPVVCFSGSVWWFSAGLCAEEEEGVAMQGSGEMALCRWNRIVIAQGKEEGGRRRRIALCFGWWWFRPPFPRSPPLPSRLHPPSSSFEAPSLLLLLQTQPSFSLFSPLKILRCDVGVEEEGGKGKS